MAANYLHGVETIDIKTGSKSIRTVKSSVIGLVGIAPTHLLGEEYQKVQEPVLVVSDIDAAKKFGPAVSGFTIPSALNAIFDQGVGTVVVVNVFDPKKHITEKNFVLDFNGKTELELEKLVINFEGPFNQIVNASNIMELTLKLGDSICVEGLDYKFKDGSILILENGKIAKATDKNVNVYAKAFYVENSDIIGGVTQEGKRFGLNALIDASALYGFSPRILIAPDYSIHEGVAAKMATIAEKLSAHAIIDVPYTVEKNKLTTVDDAISGRGTNGKINLRSSSERVVYCFPRVKVYDAVTNRVAVEPLSQRVAGVMAAKDLEEGYWVSPSNTEIKGILGTEVVISASLTDSECDANRLNEEGIMTVFSAFGTGYRLWGNRSAAFSTNTHPYNFVCVRRMADIVGESIEQASLGFVDQGINNAFIDSVRATVNAFIRTLIMRGAVVDGECYYNPNLNTPEEISAGHLVFSYDLTPSIPCERLTFERRIDISKLANLGA